MTGIGAQGVCWSVNAEVWSPHSIGVYPDTAQASAGLVTPSPAPRQSGVVDSKTPNPC